MKFPSFFRDAQKKIILRRARSWFERPEDRDDFIQTVATLALENWVERGCPLYEGEPDIYRVDYLVFTARKKVLKTQKGVTESHGGDVLLSQDKLENEWFDQKSYRPLGQMLEKCVPTNPNDRIGKEQYRLIAENGARVSLNYDELEQFTGFTRSAIGRKRIEARPLKVFIFEDGKMYPSLKQIQDRYDISEAAARWRSKIINFNWDDARPV